MTDHTELKRLAQRIVDVQTSQNEPISKLFDEFEAAASPEAVLALIAERDQLKAENESLRDAATVSAMRIKELDLLFGRYILAMRAAVIEDEHGKTETAGMDWIFNSLVGPGQLPPEGEMDAQAYFDREIVAVDKGMEEVLAFHDQRRAAKTEEASHD